MGMHIPDGFLDPPLCALMYLISLLILFYSWKKAKEELPRGFASTLGVLSALVFVAQMLNFPIVGGTSGHLVGGTFLATLFGPHVAMVSMTLVLLVQAVFFADGGITTFGANVFNMAIIGASSFYIVKILAGKNPTNRRLGVSVFVASWLSIVLSALACALEIGVSSTFAEAGGIFVTIPAMLFWHAIIGIGEGVITTSLVSAIFHLRPSLPNLINFSSPVRRALKNEKS